MSISHCYCSDYMTKPTQFGDEPKFFSGVRAKKRPLSGKQVWLRGHGFNPNRVNLGQAKRQSRASIMMIMMFIFEHLSRHFSVAMESHPSPQSNKTLLPTMVRRIRKNSVP